MKVTDEQIETLLAAIKEKAEAYAEKNGLTVYYKVVDTWPWYCLTAFLSSREPLFEDYLPAAAVNRETGKFTKLEVFGRTSVRTAVNQPRTPPTIDDYEVNVYGDVTGVGGDRDGARPLSHELEVLGAELNSLVDVYNEVDASRLRYIEAVEELKATLRGRLDENREHPNYRQMARVLGRLDWAGTTGQIPILPPPTVDSRGF